MANWPVSEALLCLTTEAHLSTEYVKTGIFPQTLYLEYIILEEDVMLVFLSWGINRNNMGLCLFLSQQNFLEFQAFS